ncbi:MAG: primosomal protein N', partial [Treponema sp.]|nr:primosomal protein N' [Treponema sp.]
MAAAPYLDLVFDIPAPRSFTYRPDPKGEAAVGKRAMVPFGKRGRDSLAYIAGERDSPPEGVKESEIRAIRRVVDREAVFDARDIGIARWISAYYLCGLGQALAAMIPSGRRAASFPSLPDDLEEIAAAPLELSGEQENALEAITGGETPEAPPENGAAESSSLAAPRPAGGEDSPSSLPSPPMFYLYGITGSGKTEVFLRAAEYFLGIGKSVIYLVPEISLTHQTAEIIKKRFGSAAATLHSGMSPGARLAEWMRIRRGEAPIVIGPRSAVFAPVRSLGLVIIDEEHDGSYKSGATPRYHARQTAIRRCSAEGAKLVMGSATPSAEAWKLMGEGVIRRLDLSRRLSGGSVPEIKAVSLEHAEGCLTTTLRNEIRATAQMGRQSILFLNRRGFAHFYHCPSCGYEQT